ncbi:MAG: bifunctional transcriptional activator/DNA repair enzyme AdaA [Planctomycetota bacterium]
MSTSPTLSAPLAVSTPGLVSGDYLRVERAIRFLTDHAAEQPSLDALAAHLNLSPFHFQRLFTRWAGVSPKRFVQSLTVEHAKRLLAVSEPVLRTSFAVGLSSPGRLHDLFVAIEAMTPGEFKAGGAGLTVRCGFGATPFGEALLARTDRGLCALRFLGDARGREKLQARRERLSKLQVEFPAAQFEEDHEGTRRWIERIFVRRQQNLPPIALHVKGTNFQVQVWRALLRIPAGAAVSYSGLADFLGHPRGARAVAQAVAHNPVGWLIPCHRVLRSSGALGGYRWGEDRKLALLARETAAQGHGVAEESLGRG